MHFSLRLFTVLTFVLMAYPSFAAPLVSPVRTPASEPRDTPESQVPPMKDGLDIGLPQTNRRSSELLLDVDDFHQFFSVSLAVRMSEDTKSPVNLINLAYHQKRRILHTHSAGVDLALNGTSMLYAGYGYQPLTLSSIRVEVLGDIGVRIVPTDGLATFIKGQNWIFRPGVAVNYHWYARHSFRAVSAIGIGTSSTEALIKLGYVWSWK